VTSDPDFKVTTFFNVEYLRNDTRYSHSYYRTLIGNQSYALYRMVTFPMSLTDPLPGFQGHSIFEVNYFKNGASQGQNFYRILVGNHTQSIKWYHFQ